MTSQPFKNEEECPGCGSFLKDREAKAARYPNADIPTHLTKCQYCFNLKCCMCDMGDDTSCISCEGDN